ncbi:MAG: DUF393 domain-containing protein [Chitinivibrionales bacterium]|nr:DUF393 domain-containing protein [Chitinivibrionales bacterium]
MAGSNNHTGTAESGIVLYDGQCPLCCGAVKFIITRDPLKKISFAALQSDVAHQFLRQRGITEISKGTMYFLDQGRLYSRSSAALHIARHLKSPWNLLGRTTWIPAALRDVLYDLIAQSRYRIFGRMASCWIPPWEHRGRFIDRDHHTSFPG